VLPAYLVGREVEQNTRFNITRSMLVPSGEGYVINPLSSGASYFFTNREQQGKVELFMNPEESPSRKALENIQQVAQKRRLDLVVHFLKPAAQNLVCVKELEPEKLQPFLSCLEKDETEKCYANYQINQQEVESCDDASILASDAQRAKAFYINTAPVFVFSNQYKKGGSLSPELLEEAFCSVNAC
ncbi:MAG: hypothetical protein Q7S65_00060, partial [Nanoarchaeota archaeon]|nr:hypothetical protein [Nanoarchaeota archaeon]